MARNEVGIPFVSPTRYVGPGANIIPIRKVAREPLTSDNSYPIGQFWIVDKNPTTGAVGDIWYLSDYVTNLAIWIQLILGTSTPPILFPADDSNTAVPAANLLNIFGIEETSTRASGNTISIFSPRVAKFVVDPTLDLGTHQTIQAAIDDASSGDTIFVRPGIYTEDLTLKDRVFICAFSMDFHEAHTSIVGKMSATFQGTTALQGFVLQTNGDYFLEVTGANTTTVNLNRCFLNAQDNDGISINIANGIVKIDRCTGNINIPATKMWDVSDGVVNVRYTRIDNSGSSTTPSNIDGTRNSRIGYSNLQFPISTSGSVDLNLFYTFLENPTTNATSLICASTGTHQASHCKFQSGTGTAITVTDNLLLSSSVIESSNTSAIDGAGTLEHTGLSFSDTSSNITTTTQTIRSEGPSRTIGSDNTGDTNTLTVENSSDTASSGAEIVSSVGGTSAADAVYKSEVSGTQTYTWGIDNDADDTWKLAASATLGSTDTFIMTSAGERTMPLNPAFLAKNTVTDTNQTGMALTPTVEFNAEEFDQGGNFAANIFTAPVAGRYELSTCVTLNNLTAANTGGQLIIAVTGRTFTQEFGNIGAVRSTGNVYAVNLSVIVDLAAAQTARVNVAVTGGAGDTVGIVGSVGTDFETFFSGCLVT